MSALGVPVPELAWKPPGGAPQIQQPVDLKLPSLAFPDGAEATEAEAEIVGAYVYRLGVAGEELWNETEKRWAEVPVELGALPPLPLTYKAGDPFPWQGMLVAVGQKDKDDNPRFQPASGGAPRYRVRAYARFKREGVEFSGLSAPSPELQFVDAQQTERFKVLMDPEDLQQVQEIRLLLKSASLDDAGYLKISTSGGNQVEIANCDASGAKLASVLLAADGSIQLTPAAGKKIVLARDLEAQQIRYLSSDGITVKDLD